MSFISYLKDGISLGSVYAIIALGYTMVYGIAKMLNFAHGDVIMVGAYVVLTLMTKGGVSPVIAVLISMGVCTVLGMTIEAVAYRPLRKGLLISCSFDYCYWSELSSSEPCPVNFWGRRKDICKYYYGSIPFPV